MERPESRSSEVVSAAPFIMSYMDIAGGHDKEFDFLGGFHVQDFPRRTGRPLHQHPHYEIVYVLAGEFVQHMENGAFRYQTGDACFLNRNVKHREGYESDCTLVFLNLQQEFLESLYAPSAVWPDHGQYRPGEIKRFMEENRDTDVGLEREYLDFAGTLALRQSSRQPETSRILDQIAEEMVLGVTGYAFRVQALLLRFFEELENPDHYHLSRIRVRSNSEDYIYARLIQYLEAHHGKVTRSELGEILHYNGDYLNRVVKRRAGMTISQLGQSICLRDAKRLLADTDMSISAVINELGFTNRTYFYRMFTNAVGISPQGFREQHKKRDSSLK